MRIGSHLLLLGVVLVVPARESQDANYPDRRAHIVNSCPFVELSKFSFQNVFERAAGRFVEKLSWKNVGDKPLVAFEVVVMKYDAFDQRMIGSRWTVTGKNSADWTALKPGEESSDGTSGYGEEDVYTAIAYVRAARLADGMVWRVNESKLLEDLRRLMPRFGDFGSLQPDTRPAKPR